MLSITDIFDRYHVPWKPAGSHHHVRTGWGGVDCPKCSPNSGKYRLGFELAGRRANCWVCGRCDPVQMLEMLCRVSNRQAAQLWHQRGALYQQPQERLQGQLKEPAGIGELQPQHRRYLQDRGFDADTISRLWGVRGIGLAARLPWRLFIPIYDRSGRQVSWTTRSIDPQSERRYISASPAEELLSHKAVMYGAHLCRSVIVVVEGPTDAWAVGPGAAATCGLGCTPQQIGLMADYAVRVTCFDNEPAAQQRADTVCRQLDLFGHTENVVLESGSDPATADPAEIAELRAKYLE